MKLFLSSESITKEQGPAFAQLIDKPLSVIKVAYIENAADVAIGKPSWVDDNRTNIQALGCKLTRIDLRNFVDGTRKISLVNVLNPYDVIWLGGGNTYYLRWLLYRTGADVVIVDLVKSGKVYGGGSAGAIVAGPTINYFQSADDPNKAKELILDGLHLIETVVIPHWDSDDYGPIMKIAEEKLKQAGYKTEHITNTQAIIIDGDKKYIVPSTR
jgi:dipeptidase E